MRNKLACQETETNDQKSRVKINDIKIKIPQSDPDIGALTQLYLMCSGNTEKENFHGKLKKYC